MKEFMRVFRIVHGLMAFLFAFAALMLITIAARMGWLAFVGGLDRAASQAIIEAVDAGRCCCRTANRRNHFRGRGHSRRRHKRADSRATLPVEILRGRYCRAGHRRPRRDVQSHARRSDPTAPCSEHPGWRRNSARRVGPVRSPQSFCRGTRAGSDGGRQAGRPQTQISSIQCAHVYPMPDPLLTYRGTVYPHKP